MLLAIGQKVLNDQIRASTAARDRIATLEGKRFAVTLEGSDLRIVVEAANGELRLSRSTESAADVELCSGAYDLMKLARTSSLSELKTTGATISGELHVAEGFADLFRLALPDAEGWLAGWIGDMPAHALGRAARGAGAWTQRAGHAFEQNLAEYLQEESPTLVPPALARHFMTEVDRIRDDVERAERRIELLERRLGGQGG